MYALAAFVPIKLHARKNKKVHVLNEISPTEGKSLLLLSLWEIFLFDVNNQMNPVETFLALCYNEDTKRATNV